MRSTALLAIPVALLLARTAFAAEIDSPRLFAQLDADGDGRVTTAEAGDAHARLFSRLVRTSDEDSDGQLTADEFAAALTPVRADKASVRKQGSRLPGGDALVVIIARMDVDGNRQLTADEIPAEFRGAFAAMVQRGDADKNGNLDTRELADGGPQLALIAQASAARLGIDVAIELAKLPPQRRQSIERMGSFPNPMEMLADPKQAAELFAQLDANGDKLVSVDEAPQGIARIIERLDRDGDGKLSKEEMAAISRRGAGGNARPGSGAPANRANGRGNLRQLLSRMDRDGDGSLSREELPPRMAEAFERIDRDGDGAASLQELQRFSRSRPRPQPSASDGESAEKDEQMQ